MSPSSIDVRRFELRSEPVPPARLVLGNLLAPLLRGWCAALRSGVGSVPGRLVASGLLVDESDAITSAFAERWSAGAGAPHPRRMGCPAAGSRLTIGVPGSLRPISQHVVIAGGGFGGYYTAKTLERLAPPGVRITLISDVNFMLYTPLLPGAAAGTLDPRHIVVPLREHLRRTSLRLGYVTGGDPARSVIQVDMIAGMQKEYRYDHLVVALGSIARVVPIPGLVEHAIGFKTIAEATALRNRIIRQMEVAEGIDDPDSRRVYLSFVFIGGGYAGLEGIAELADFARDAIRRYPRCREVGTSFTLIDVADRIMPEIQPELADFTLELLRSRGIEFRLGIHVTEVRDDSITLSTGETLPCRTVVWTAGVRASPFASRLGLPLDHGRIVCDEFMRVEGFRNVWALGDIAAVPDPARPGMPCPPTAQHAIRQGKLMAQTSPR